MSLPTRFERIRRKMINGVHQLAGNFNIALCENDRRIRALKDSHAGQTAFVLGNGPSLATDDLDRLKKFPTFASNKIYLAFTNTDWRPSYYSVIDVLVAENNQSSIHEVKATKIYSSDIIPYLGNAITPDITWLHNRYYNQSNQDSEFKFSNNLMAGIHAGWTVIYTQLQVAYYMGFTQVYLLGLDFNFTQSPSTGKICAHGEVLESHGEINHFHKDYRQLGETWTIPRLDLQAKAFLAARRAFEADGRKLINASRQTKLDCLERANLDEVLTTLSR